MHGGADGSGAPRGRGNGRYKFGRHTETARRWRAGLRALQAQAAIIPRLPIERQDAALIRLCDAVPSIMDRQGEYLPELAQIRSVMRLMTRIEAIGAKRLSAHASSGDALGAILARLTD